MKTKIPYTTTVNAITIDIMEDSGLLSIFGDNYSDSDYEFEVYLIIIREEIEAIRERIREISSLLNDSEIARVESDLYQKNFSYKTSEEEILRFRKIGELFNKVSLAIEHNFSDSYHISRLNELLWLASDGLISSSLNRSTEDSCSTLKDPKSIFDQMKLSVTALKTLTGDFISESDELLKLTENIKSLSEIRERISQLKRVYKCLFFDILNISENINILNRLSVKPAGETKQNI